MSTRLSLPTKNISKDRLQAYALLLLGVVFLIMAWLLHPSTGEYPVGVLLLGMGMLLATVINPFRLVSASFLVTFLGIAVYLAFKHLIPGNQILSYYILAIGLALLGIALMARRGYVKAGAVTPGLLIIIVGILEYLLAAGLTPTTFLPFMLSLWLPGFGLFAVGFIYLAATFLKTRRSKL
jgi:hypothetical protein